jgi:carbon monoxide dehydrogenase subunit G
VKTSFPVVASRDAWAALADPERLAAALPGCRSVTRAADHDGALHVVTEVALASVRGLWAGTVVPVDADAVRVSGSGAPGTVDLIVRADPGRTALTVEGTVDGPLGTVGSAVLAAALRRTAQDLLAGAAPAEPLPVPVTDPVGSQPVPSPDARHLTGRRRAVAAAGVVVTIVVAIVVGGRARRGAR